MMNQKDLHDLLFSLLNECTKKNNECEWIELKHNNSDPHEIGEYVSALANSAALLGKPSAYIVWGIENTTRTILGTTFSPKNTKKGNEEFENWLLRKLTPAADLQIFEWNEDGHPISLIRVNAANNSPISFEGTEFVRVGSYKKKLKDYPEKERALWAVFSSTAFEKNLATQSFMADQILNHLDYPAYYELTTQNIPENRSAILERFVAEKIITNEGDKYFITNLGAILFARNISSFDLLARKACRVIVYKDRDRIQTLREWPGEKIHPKGYANGFEEIINFVNSQLPQNEDLTKTLRREVRTYPEIAIRELVANALIHQGFGRNKQRRSRQGLLLARVSQICFKRQNDQ